jgi:hypothetical protein
MSGRFLGAAQEAGEPTQRSSGRREMTDTIIDWCFAELDPGDHETALAG